jgi:hypothetical protein
MFRRGGSARAARAGQTLAEATLVLPLLLLLLVGIVDFGHLFNQSIIVTNAARAGARQGALDRSDTHIVGAIQGAASTLDPERLSWRISPPEGDEQRSSGHNLAVEVWYVSEVPIPLPGVLGSQRLLYAKTVMRIQAPLEPVAEG